MKYKFLFIFTFFNLSYCAEHKKEAEAIAVYAEVEIQNTLTDVESDNIKGHILAQQFNLSSYDKFVLLDFKSIDLNGTNFFDENIKPFIAEKVHYLPLKDLIDGNGELKKILILNFENFDYQKKTYQLVLTLKLLYKDKAFIKLEYQNSNNCVIL